MRKIAVFVACILFSPSVASIVASTNEITAARIAGENDAKGFQWKWFAAGYLTPILFISAAWAIEESDSGVFDDVPSSYCAVTYGIIALTPTVFSLIHSPVPPADRLLGKSPDWVNAYTQAYQRGVKRHRAAASLGGCVAGTATLVSTVGLIVAVYSGSTPGSD